MADQLKEINFPLPNDDLVAYALMELPRDYESFTTSITNGRDTVIFDELRTKLIHQEHRLQQSHSDNPFDMATVFQAQLVNEGMRGT